MNQSKDVIKRNSRVSYFSMKGKAYFISGRPYLWLYGSVTIVCGYSFALLKAKRLEHSFSEFLDLVILVVFMPSLLSYFVNTFNAVFDVESDKVTKPFRPIPSGVMTEKEALISSFVAAGAAFLLSLAFLKLEHTILVLLGIIMGIVYSTPIPRVKSNVYLANLWIGIGYTLFGLLGGWFYLYSLVDLLKTPFIVYMFIMLMIHTALATIVKDLVDMAGDLKAGVKTLPLVFGEEKAVYLVVLSLWLPLLGFPLLFLFYPYMFSFFYGLIYVCLVPWAIVETTKLLKVAKMRETSVKKTKLYMKRFKSVFFYSMVFLLLVALTNILILL